MASNEELFAELVKQTRVLTIVCDNAATVLSEEFESMIRGPLAAVVAILDKCPEPTKVGSWDLDIRDEDFEVEFYSHESHQEGPPRAARVTHKPTELSCESYSLHDPAANEVAARRALLAILARRRKAELRQRASAA